MVALRAIDAPIFKLDYTLDVSEAVEQLYSGDYWNQHKLRTEQYVHSDVDDIWLRFRKWEDGLSLEEFNKPHTAVWYPIAGKLPALPRLAGSVWLNTAMTFEDHIEFGGVLITRIPPGGKVEPHIDSGWHAKHYTTKVAVQLLGHEDQAFCFEGHRCVALPGEVYQFDNQQLHWVENNSDQDRVTMIICMRVNDGRGA